MATRKIKSVKELPDWFCIDNYKEAKTLDARGWHTQLEIRGFCHYFLTPPAWNRKYALAPFEKIRHAAILPNRDYRDFEIRKRDREINPFNTYSVESMSRSYVGYLATDINEDEKLLYEAQQHGDTTDEQELALEESYDLYEQRRGLRLDRRANVVVNLNATDDQLLSDFKHWLAGFRQASGRPAPTKNFTHKQLDRWHQSGVLPYLDLLLWSMVEDVSIADHVMGRAIFPNEYDVDLAERIAKTTRKTAMETIAEPTVRALYAQAASEHIAEGKSRKTLPE